MASSASWLQRVAEALGPVTSRQALGGSAWRIEAGGRAVVAKVGPGSADEAGGLRLLGSVAGAPAVPEVVMGDSELLVTSWVEPHRRSDAALERLGRELAALHGTPAECWGGGSGWIGACRVDVAEHADGPAFYGARLVELARRCGLEGPVTAVARRLGELVPFTAPAVLHGDLWWGNVLWGAGDRPWLIDPSCHGGHPEEDLAMLGLFGAVPPRLVAAYGEVRPLAPGWPERVPLFQLYPLLVHAVLFGGGYRVRAEAIARHFASAS